MVLKYRNVKTVVDGITFDSKREATYYQELLMLKRAGEVLEIVCQPKYNLQPSYWKCCRSVWTLPPLIFPLSKCPICGKKIKKTQAITYSADFRVSYADTHVEIIDIKGIETKSFKDKRKMFEYQHPTLTLKVIKR